MLIGESLYFAPRSIYKVHDDAKDKDFELEISWIGPESKGKHEMVPADIIAVRILIWLDACTPEVNKADFSFSRSQEAGRKAKAALDDEMED